MQPQFLSRFDNAIILSELDRDVLQRILVQPYDGVFQTSQRFFAKYEVELELTDEAVRRIAREASIDSRIGARALKTVYAKIIKPFEFDPFSRDEVTRNGGGYRLVIDRDVVERGLDGQL